MLTILFYGFLVFSPFLREHWVHDTYCISQYGYNFMSGLFSQGRVISHFFYKILYFFDPPYSIAMTLSVSASLIFLSVSSFLVFYLINESSVDNDDEPDKKTLVLALIGSISIFFNVFILDSLLFLENAVMSFGILLSALSCYCFLRDDRACYFVSLILLVGGVFCYQADIAFFLPLTLIFIGARHRRHEIKTCIKKCLLACSFYAVALISNYLFLQAISTTDTRAAGEIDVFTNIKKCLEALGDFFENTFEFLPAHLLSFFVIVLLIIFIVKAIKTKNYLGLTVSVLAFITLIICAILPHVAMASDRWYVMPRSAVAIAGIVGLIMVGLSVFNEKTNVFGLIFCAVFLLIISQTQIDIQKNNYANNKLDEQEILYIVNKIEDYEAENNLIIERVYFVYDQYQTYYRETLNNYQDLTIRIMSVGWMPFPMLERYMGREYPREEISTEDYDRLFKDKNWDEFRDEQLVFEGRTAYICIY